MFLGSFIEGVRPVGGRMELIRSRTRAGFVATTKSNRQDFGVSSQDTMDRSGIVVGNEIDITIDAERFWKTSDDNNDLVSRVVCGTAHSIPSF